MFCDRLAPAKSGSILVAWLGRSQVRLVLSIARVRVIDVLLLVLVPTLGEIWSVLTRVLGIWIGVVKTRVLRIIVWGMGGVEPLGILPVLPSALLE